MKKHSAGRARRLTRPVVALPLATLAVVATITPLAEASSSSAVTMQNGMTSPRLAYRASPTPTGYGLAVDSGTFLTIPNGCGVVSTGTSAAMASVAFTAVGGTKTSKIRVGTASWRVSPGQAVTAVEWLPLQAGNFSTCFDLTRLRSASIQLLAHTVVPTQSSPGGLINISARIPMPTSGTTSGQWTVPTDATPSTVGGLILEVSSTASDVLAVSSGGSTVTVDVGPSLPATTLVLPPGTPVWTDTSGTAPNALLLGFITAQDDSITGGALLNVSPAPFNVRGATVRIAGKDGLPISSAQIPVTSVLAAATGNNPAIEDPLGAGQQTLSGTTPRIGTQSFFRVAADGAIHLTGRSRLRVVAWLAGDEIKAPNAIDLTAPHSPHLKANPTSNTLTFAGTHSFPVGSTLILGVSRYTPTGLVAIVDATASAKRTTTVTYTTGALLDAFTELTLVGEIPAASPSSPQPAEAVDGRRIDSLASLGVTDSLAFSLSRSVTFGPITGTLSFHFNPSVTVALTVGTGWFGLPSSVSLHYAVDTSTSVTASLTAQAGYSGQASVSLPRLSLTPFDLGPVVVVPELIPSLTVSAGISASVTLSGTVSEHSHVGMTMQDGLSRGFAEYPDPGNGFGAPAFSGASLETSISANAQATLALQFALLAYGEVGPDAQASATLAFDVNPTSTPAWEVTASGDFSIGINLNALNIGILTSLLHVLGISTDPSWSIGHLGPYVIASGAGGSTGGSTGGVGAPGAGGSGPGGTTGASSGSGSGSGAGTTQAPPGAAVTVGQGPAAPYGYRFAVTLQHFVPNSSVLVTCYDSQDPSGFYSFPLATDGNGNASTSAYCFSAAGPNYWVVAGGLQSNTVQWGSSGGGTPPAPGASVTIGWSISHPGWITMTLAGFPVGSYSYTCQFASGGNQSFTVAVESSPETIDNGETCYDLEAGDTVSVSVASVQSNSLIVGGAPQSGSGETTGGVTNTWSDYADAGGTQGPTVQGNETVAISCRVQGFTVADGNNWWYQISSSPWSNAYYASADAFYNDGQTSGSLIGTPFVDTAVPVCNTSPPPAKSITIGWGSNPAPYGNWMNITFTNFPTGSVSWYCVEEGTAYGPYSTTLTSSTETFTSHTCYDTQPGGSDYVTSEGVNSNTIPTD